MEKLYLTTPKEFSFKSTLYSHGWSDLPPFKLVKNPLHITYVVKNSSQDINFLSISDLGDQQLEITADSELNDQEKNQVMVKMLCTTNCTWRLTQIMTENLVLKLGTGKKIKESGKTIQAFPGPEEIAKQTEEYLRNEIKMGYRAPYLLEFASAIASSKLDLDEVEDNSLSTTDIYKKIRQLKGFGDYAVSNLLKLLGRYDNMGADSWSRQKFFEKHHGGKSGDDKNIQSHYKKFGKWAGLFFWMDVSEEWYRKEVPW